MNVEPLQLPKELPDPKAIASFGQNERHYNPDNWEIEYIFYRYLKNLKDNDLIIRYRAIRKNLEILVNAESDKIPIVSFLSSWYWHRKEHQTRLEFFLRGLTLPDKDSNPYMNRLKPFEVPLESKDKRYGEVLFRFGNSCYMKHMVEHGDIRIRLASEYIKEESCNPRYDDEKNKTWFYPGEHSRITQKEGMPIPVIGDISSSVFCEDYYMLSMACGYDPIFYDDSGFNYDTCVVIREPAIFSDRIQQAVSNMFPDAEYLDLPVQYYDPCERTQNEYILPQLYKDFQYAYQMEYRFVWLLPIMNDTSRYFYTEIGPLDDIAYLYRP